MSPQSYCISIRKEAFKFSAAHMTVFPDGSKESLHGHNYTTKVEIALSSIAFEKLISFSVFKKSIKKICQEWDEKVLLAALCPFMKEKQGSPQEVEFYLCNKRYVLPRDEVVFLPTDNITAETLAQEFCRCLREKFSKWIKSKALLEIAVSIEESPGQGATCKWSP